MTNILNKFFQDGKSKSLLLCEEQNFNIILIGRKFCTAISETLQSLISQVCGHYAVCYILFRSRSCSLPEILSHFSGNVALNDRTVQRFVENLLK